MLPETSRHKQTMSWSHPLAVLVVLVVLLVVLLATGSLAIGSMSSVSCTTLNTGEGISCSPLVML